MRRHDSNQLSFLPLPQSPLVVSYGMGVDSTAVLVEFARRSVRPDLILFADTGGEKPDTHAFRPVMDAFLQAVGFPPITDVKYVVRHPRRGRYETLEEECLLHGKLPALAYGGHQCSQKWKIGPQQRFIAEWTPARAAWRHGLPVRQVIGFDAGPRDQRRCNRLPEDRRFQYWTPLVEWGWNREECTRQIRACRTLSEIAGRFGVDPVPPKSACFFCPASKPEEVFRLHRLNPDLTARALLIEENAAPNLRGTQGLFRTATKTRPGSWTELLTGVPLLETESHQRVSA